MSVFLVFLKFLLIECDFILQELKLKFWIFTSMFYLINPCKLQYTNIDFLFMFNGWITT